MAFSGLVKAQFPPINKISGKLSEYREPSAIHLKGLPKSYDRAVFQWMLSCCNGKGMQACIPSKSIQFVDAHHQRQAAEKLQIPVLLQQIREYMTRRLASRDGLCKEEVIALHGLGIYFHYRSTSEEIPAREIELLIVNLRSDDAETLKRLVEYVVNVTLQDMQAKREAKANTQGRKEGQRKPRYSSHQYAGLREKYVSFGSAVNEGIELSLLGKRA